MQDIVDAIDKALWFKSTTLCHWLLANSAFEKVATFLGGGLMYLWNALLRQRPSNCIWVSDRFASEADVAAPIRKLCVLYSSLFNLIFEKTDFLALRNICEVQPIPFLMMNNGPGLLFLFAK